MTFNIVRTFAAIAVGASISMLAPATAAFAHAHLLSSQPADKEMAMPAPTELKLTFSEGLEVQLCKVQLVGPDKKELKTGPLRLDPKDDKLLIVPLPAGLPDGTYTVNWQAIAKDTHKTTGSYTFDSMQ
jgi:methionine-rich copper-binding protein CopC